MSQQELEERRRELVATIKDQLQSLSASVKLNDAAVAKTLDVMSSTPRENFIDAALRHAAYANQALPIAHGQTISQPFVVALMTAALDLQTSDRVLEVGTGCGYQTAVLSRLCQAIFSIEIVSELQRQAKETLARMNVRNVNYRVSDGHSGWLEAGPFNAILVAAAADTIPPELVSQLAAGGRMVLPVEVEIGQSLMLVRKRDDSTVETTNLLPVRFVPLLESETGRDGR